MASVRPRPLSDTVRQQFRRQRTRDTGPEMALRRELHRRGMRYRVDASPLGGRRRADILFTKARVAVFVDGCFWHGCLHHKTRPKHNAVWWQEKINRNVARDREVDAELERAGWTVVRVWEHEDPARAADRVEARVRQLGLGDAS